MFFWVLGLEARAPHHNFSAELEALEVKMGGSIEKINPKSLGPVFSP